ncbi:MAG: hypothetical protein RDU20_06945 [Desulfomonilaceae bacterium]|nr:hypothetical protein [Desulfomonilaceae bacterium]
MSRRTQVSRPKLWKAGLILTTFIVGGFVIPGNLRGETYGIVNAANEFEPKVTIQVKKREIEIRKVNPADKFDSIALQVNPRNASLIRNVGLLKIEWISARDVPGRPLPFAGPRYDPNTRTYQDAMIPSVALKVLNTSTRPLFEGKAISDLFIVKINNEPLVSAESIREQPKTVRFGTGEDISIKIDRNTVVFNEDNYKKGEILNVDNRSGLDQVLGVELPTTGLLYYQVIRKPEQSKIPKENWNRFTVSPDSGIFIVVIPERDPAQLIRLDGQEIVINIYDDNRIRESRRIPVHVAADLRRDGAGYAERPDTGAIPSTELPGPDEGAVPQEPPGTRIAEPPARDTRPGTLEESRSGMWFWILQVSTLVILLGVAVYAFFFMLPRIQVLEDRLAKNEMFIHGSREAIRDELDQIKKEILDQCRSDAEPE